MNKSEIRSKMKELRKNMSIQDREKADDLIFERLLSLYVINQAEWLYLYVSYGTEADTSRVIQHFFKENSLIKNEKQKHIAVPKVNGNGMEFYEIFSFDDLKEGYHGIPEPEEGQPVHVKDAVMIMPGLAFDSSFNRVGYGGGYYDRYLRRNEEANIIKIAVAYDFQMIEKEIIDTQKYDKKPDIIVTDKNVYYRK